MINHTKIILLIENALIQMDTVVAKSKYLREDKEPILSNRKVLNLLKTELQQNKNDINHRILRAMHDVGMSAYKDFENTPVERAINDISTVLYAEIPNYKYLKPLRNDFGRGEPI